MRDIALYAQDQWTIRKLTLNLGVRFNDAKASTPEQVLGAGFWVPERRFEPTDDVPHWRTSVRASASPTISSAPAERRSRPSLGHYPDRVITAAANPAANSDAEHHHQLERPQRELQSRLQSAQPGGDSSGADVRAWQSPTFGQAARRDDSTPTRRRRASTVSRTTGRARSRFSTSCGRASGVNVGLLPDVVRRLPGHRQSGSGLDLLRSRICITAPVDDRLPAVSAASRLCGFYDIKPQFFGTIGGVVKQTSDFGTRTQVYNGVDITTERTLGPGSSGSGRREHRAHGDRQLRWSWIRRSNGQGSAM